MTTIDKNQETWLKLIKDDEFLQKPFEAQLEKYVDLFGERPCNDSIHKAWVPGEYELNNSNIAQLQSEQGFSNYHELLHWSRNNSQAFLSIMLEKLKIPFMKEPSTIYKEDKSAGPAQWLPDAIFNIAEACLNKTNDDLAIITHNSHGELQEISYGELQQRSTHIAHSLHALDLPAHSRIGIALPMHADAIAALLGVILAGHSAVMIAESFSEQEIATRFIITEPVYVLTQNVIKRGEKEIPLYPKVKAASKCPCIVMTAPSTELSIAEGDITWNNFLLPKKTFNADENFNVATATSAHEALILFSSGTSGTPKAIPWYHHMPIKSACDGHLHHDLQRSDRLCWPTSLGWMMGPWVVFATLINGSTIALSDYAPQSKAFGEFVQNAGVTVLGLVPSLVRAWRANEAIEKLDWSTIKLFSSTGECSQSEDMLYLMSLANYRPVIEYCGGTETAGGYITSTITKACIPGTFNSPALGFSWLMLNEKNELCQNGEVFFEPPTFGCSDILLNADHEKVYFSGAPQGPQAQRLRRHGDHIELLEHGHYRAQGRMDDTMNLGGIKISAIEIERVINRHPLVKESAAIDKAREGGGPSELHIFTVLSKTAAEMPAQNDLQKLIREHLNPLFKITQTHKINELPRTASNKIMRRLLKKQIAAVKALS